MIVVTGEEAGASIVIPGQDTDTGTGIHTGIGIRGSGITIVSIHMASTRMAIPGLEVELASLVFGGTDNDREYHGQ